MVCSSMEAPIYALVMKIGGGDISARRQVTRHEGEVTTIKCALRLSGKNLLGPCTKPFNSGLIPMLCLEGLAAVLLVISPFLNAMRCDLYLFFRRSEQGSSRHLWRHITSFTAPDLTYSAETTSS
jgi:hypothetical protein